MSHSSVGLTSACGVLTISSTDSESFKAKKSCINIVENVIMNSKKLVNLGILV